MTSESGRSPAKRLFPGGRRKGRISPEAKPSREAVQICRGQCELRHSRRVMPMRDLKKRFR